MVTLAAKTMDYNHIIKDLIALEHDAIAAYYAAIERLENKEYKIQLSEFVADHELHLAELAEYAQALNIEVNSGPDAKVMLTKGKVVLANIFGDDAILAAMKTNEDDTVTAYERACKHENLSPEIRETFQKGYNDEMRHRAWIETAAKDKNERAA